MRVPVSDWSESRGWQVGKWYPQLDGLQFPATARENSWRHARGVLSTKKQQRRARLVREGQGETKGQERGRAVLARPRQWPLKFRSLLMFRPRRRRQILKTVPVPYVLVHSRLKTLEGEAAGHGTEAALAFESVQPAGNLCVERVELASRTRRVRWRTARGEALRYPSGCNFLPLGIRKLGFRV